MWADHFDRYPPLVVALGQISALLATRMFALKKHEIAQKIPWSKLPVLVEKEKPTVLDPDPTVDKILKAGM